MSQLLISLPPGTQFDQFTPLQLKHPKGQTVTFLAREDKLYELNHRKVETNMCFSTMDDKTTSKSHFMPTLAENFFSSSTTRPNSSHRIRHNVPVDPATRREQRKRQNNN